MNFQFHVLSLYKILAFRPPPSEFPMIFLGVGMDIFWNHMYIRIHSKFNVVLIYTLT